MSVQPLQAPPPFAVDITDDSWKKWLTSVWETIGKGTPLSGPQAVFPQLQVSDATFTGKNIQVGLLTLNRGLYVNYTSPSDTILYGDIVNVTRARGSGNVVAGQFAAWAGRDSVAGYTIFGVVSQAVSYVGADVALISHDASLASFSGSITRQKIGLNLTFKDRAVAGTNAPNGISSNQYNLWAQGIVFTSQARSPNGEFCGWNVGCDFLDGFDIDLPTAYSAGVTYVQGQVVTTGGRAYKAKQTTTGNAPVAPPGTSAFWACVNQYTSIHYAVGIDFSAVSDAQQATLWSAIRLRDDMFFSWEQTGSVNTWYDLTNGRVVFSTFNGATHTRTFEIDVGSGLLYTHTGLTALGGGAAATLGTIGGTGPATAAQNSWYKMIDNNTGASFWVPVWK